MIVNDFTVIESIHGRFIVNRHCDYQIDYIAKTGIPHIQPEIDMILAVVSTLPEGCVIFDVGANIGLISVPMAQAVKTRDGTVHAFEVQRLLFQALCGTAVLNDLSNLWVHAVGLSDKQETLAMPSVNYGAQSDYGLVSLKDAEPVRMDAAGVKVFDMDSMPFPRLDLIKIDVEGMENKVLAGARQTLVKQRPWCWVEYHMSDVHALKSAFDGLDYVFYRADALNMLCAPRDKLARSGLKIQAEEL